MRRIGVLWLLGVLALAGCAGQEGQRAEELLERAARAQDHLVSATFVADLTVEGSGQTFGMTVEGGAYFKGRRSGDMFVQLDGSGTPAAAGSFGVVVKDGRAYFSDGSGWESLPLPESRAGATGQLGAADVSRTMASLVAHVEDVSVSEGKVFRGEPATFVSGRLDGAGLLRTLASDLSAAGGLSTAAPLSVDDLAKNLGDIDASLMLSDRTGLLIGAVVSIEISGEQPSELELIYRLTSTNERIRLPGVPS